jgi:hypothetical protein
MSTSYVREVALAAGDESVAREVDQHTVVVFGDRGQPDLQLVADVGDGGLLVDQLVHVLGGKLAALRADERGVDVLGVAVGVLQLRGSSGRFLYCAIPITSA